MLGMETAFLEKGTLRPLKMLVGRLYSQQWVMREDSWTHKGPSPSARTEKLSPGLNWGLRGIRIPLVLGGEARGHVA